MTAGTGTVYGLYGMGTVYIQVAICRDEANLRFLSYQGIHPAWAVRPDLMCPKRQHVIRPMFAISS